MLEAERKIGVCWRKRAIKSNSDGEKIYMYRVRGSVHTKITKKAQKERNNRLKLQTVMISFASAILQRMKHHARKI